MLRFIRPLSVSIFTIASLIGGEALASPNEVLIAKLIRSGETRKAFNELKKSDPKIEDVLFFRGLVSQKNKDFDEAISLFNEALSKNPNHLNARREIARTLILKKDYSIAERAFLELIEIDKTPGMEEIYEKHIQYIRSKNPFGISGHFSILPSSNVNRGTEKLVYNSTIGKFVISPESKKKSGVGIQAGASGYFRFLSTEKSTNTALLSVNGNIYEESDFNLSNSIFTIIHSRLLNEITRVSAGAYTRYSWREDDSDSGAIGITLGLNRVLTPKDILSFGLRHEEIKFFSKSRNTGPFSSLSASLRHQQNPSLSYNIGLSATQRTPRTDHSAYQGLELSAGINKEWVGGLNTELSLNAGLRKYDGDFPLAGEPRKDDFYGVTVSLQKDDWSFKGFVPRLSCSYTKNVSNIEFYEYDVSECDLSIDRKF